MSDLPVEAVKAITCQALYGDLSKRGLNSKGNKSSLQVQDCWLAQLALGSEVCSSLKSQPHESADTARQPEARPAPMLPPPPGTSSSDAGTTDLRADSCGTRFSRPLLRNILAGA